LQFQDPNTVSIHAILSTRKDKDITNPNPEDPPPRYARLNHRLSVEYIYEIGTANDGTPFLQAYPQNHERASRQPPTSGCYSGVWYPFPNPSPSREAYWCFCVGTGANHARFPRYDGDGQPTHLARCLLGRSLLVVPVTHSAHPDQPEGGLTARPLSPKMLFPPPKGLAGMVWDGLGLGKCILHFWSAAYNCSILHIVVGYICATYWNSYVHYTTYVYVDAWGGGEEGCCTRITVYYIGR
jgi:hypothetical protein